MVFPVVMYGCESDCEESWAPKNWCFWTVVLEKTLESPLACKEIKPVHPKGNQPWTFIGRTDAETEAPILWPPDVKSQLTGKDPDAGKDWGQEEKGAAENEMVGWHHWLNGHEFQQSLRDGDGQRSLACCGSWSLKELDTTEGLNWTEGFVTQPSGLTSIPVSCVTLHVSSLMGLVQALTTSYWDYCNSQCPSGFLQPV